MDKHKIDLSERLAGIRAIAMDIDGVLTDGTIIPLDDGYQLRHVDVKDAFAMRAAINKGLTLGIISGGNTPALRKRFSQMGISEENLHLGVRGKLHVFEEFCKHNGVDPIEVMYMGDDIPDTQVMRACGVAVAPADAALEAIEAADIVSSRPGGRGCAREILEKLMKIQGLWNFAPDKFHEIY